MKKSLKYYRLNAEEDYMITPISVLRYITEAEREIKILRIIGLSIAFLFFVGAILILNK